MPFLNQSVLQQRSLKGAAGKKSIAEISSGKKNKRGKNYSFTNTSQSEHRARTHLVIVVVGGNSIQLTTVSQFCSRQTPVATSLRGIAASFVGLIGVSSFIAHLSLGAGSERETGWNRHQPEGYHG